MSVKLILDSYLGKNTKTTEKDLGDGCGRLMWLAWGGDAGIEWAQRKLKQIRNEKGTKQ